MNSPGSNRAKPSAPRAPKSGGGILPFKRDHGQLLVLLAREHKKGVQPKHARWGEFGARVSNPKELDRIQAALSGFEEETGISAKELEIGGKPLADRIHEEGSLLFSSDVDNYSIFPSEVAAETSKGFPTIGTLKETLKTRRRAYKRAKLDGNLEEARRLKKSISKDDFRWVPLDLLKKLAAFDTVYYDEDVRVVSEWSGETFTINKEFLNLLKENNTWGKPFLTFGK